MSLKSKLDRKINRNGKEYTISRLDPNNLDLSGEPTVNSTEFTAILYIFEEKVEREQIEVGGKPKEIIEFLAKSEEDIQYGDKIYFELDELQNPIRIFTVKEIMPYRNGEQIIAKEYRAERVLT